VCVCVCVCVYVPIYMPIYLSVCLSVCLSVRPSVHPSIHLCLPVRPCRFNRLSTEWKLKTQFKLEKSKGCNVLCYAALCPDCQVFVPDPPLSNAGRNLTPVSFTEFNGTLKVLIKHTNKSIIDDYFCISVIYLRIVFTPVVTCYI
jgi:hypothetical protein